MLPKNGLSVVLAFFVCACSPPPERARYTLEEYRANTELRHAQVARCQSDPGTLKKTPDCINAQQAAAFEDRVRLRDLPPIGLDPKRNPSGARSNVEPSAPPARDEMR
jgi:hypothetical protein